MRRAALQLLERLLLTGAGAGSVEGVEGVGLEEQDLLALEAAAADPLVSVGERKEEGICVAAVLRPLKSVGRCLFTWAAVLAVGEGRSYHAH